jgi:hypothetical protein
MYVVAKIAFGMMYVSILYMCLNSALKAMDTLGRNAMTWMGGKAHEENLGEAQAAVQIAEKGTAMFAQGLQGMAHSALAAGNMLAGGMGGGGKGAKGGTSGPGSSVNGPSDLNPGPRLPNGSSRHGNDASVQPSSRRGAETGTPDTPAGGTSAPGSYNTAALTSGPSNQQLEANLASVTGRVDSLENKPGAPGAAGPQGLPGNSAPNSSGRQSGGSGVG